MVNNGILYSNQCIIKYSQWTQTNNLLLKCCSEKNKQNAVNKYCKVSDYPFWYVYLLQSLHFEASTLGTDQKKETLTVEELLRNWICLTKKALILFKKFSASSITFITPNHWIRKSLFRTKVKIIVSIQCQLHFVVVVVVVL